VRIERKRRKDAQGDNYLTWLRPGARGIVSIGVLVLALAIGGNGLKLDSSPAKLFLPVSAQAEEVPAAAPAPLSPFAAFTEYVRFTPLGRLVQGAVTHYGASYSGQPMACGGLYLPENPTIIAVGPDHYAEWPCGTFMVVCGSAGCLVGVRQDSCPGCTAGVLDLSEAGIAIVCGPGTGTCSTTAHALKIQVLSSEEAAANSNQSAQPQ
jgi:hypothetical protein